MPGTENLQRKLSELFTRYRKELPGKLTELENNWNQACRGEDTQEAIKNAYRISHSLTGNSALYGFKKISPTSEKIELILKSLINDSSPPTAEDETAFRKLFEELKEITENASLTQDLPGTLYDEIEEAGPLNPKQVYLMDKNPKSGEALSEALKNYGYEISYFTALKPMYRSLENIQPSLIIVDISLLSKSELAYLYDIINETGSPASRSARIYFAESGDIKYRLAAVRAGANAFFVKPVDINLLLDRMNILSANQTQEPYRILIVEDSKESADSYSLILQKAGMSVRVVMEPLQVMQPLTDFQPDLILMDIYMPDCNGYELAEIIRQQESFVGVPIIFLSVESNRRRQLEAMRLGGDDFLTKPVAPYDLVATVTHRVQRSRLLRSYISRDSLTGLLNHNSLKEQLKVELSRSRRNEQTLSLILLDIDHFKSINDNYGHPTGDQAIKNISRMLQHEFRKTDIVGRYGGEEFALVLLNTDSKRAMEIVERFRKHFVKSSPEFTDEKLVITFSCGITTFDGSQDVTKLIIQADEALYTAKKNGRNQVVMYSPRES